MGLGCAVYGNRGAWIWGAWCTGVHGKWGVLCMGVEVHGFGEHSVARCTGVHWKERAWGWDVLYIGAHRCVVHGNGIHDVLGCTGSRVRRIGVCCVWELRCMDLGSTVYWGAWGWGVLRMGVKVHGFGEHGFGMCCVLGYMGNAG